MLEATINTYDEADCLKNHYIHKYTQGIKKNKIRVTWLFKFKKKKEFQINMAIIIHNS